MRGVSRRGRESRVADLENRMTTDNNRIDYLMATGGGYARKRTRSHGEKR